VADRDSNPAWIAVDLLSQAEHDESAQAIMITDNVPFADAVENELRQRLKNHERKKICQTSLANRGALVVTNDLDEACILASQAAPEHLELAVKDPESLLPKIHNAGAIFLGRHTPEAIGDYMAGPNHVLPTSGTARFSSPLGVHDFIKRSSIIKCNHDSIKIIGPDAARLADCEGLPSHKLSIELRLGIE
jgi:histidinol dehydrogenase